MLLIFPPTAKPSEPPAGIACLAGILKGNNLPCTLLDANLEGLFYLMQKPGSATDKWSVRSGRNIDKNLAALRTTELYASPDRYARAVSDLNRVLEKLDIPGVSVSLANYQEDHLSPLHSRDLIRASEKYEDNIFYPYFSKRLPGLLAEVSPSFIGFSLNYLSQALTTFAMIGFLKKIAPEVPIVLGGGLVTSWVRNSSWENPFAGLIDHTFAGPGGEHVLTLFGHKKSSSHYPPDYTDLPCDQYLAPGFTLPYAASSGCYWNKCSFCPEKAEGNPYQTLPIAHVRQDIALLVTQHDPVMFHFLDNAVSPALMKSLIDQPLDLPWYGFARVNNDLLDIDFCQNLRASGCVMLKLGIESGDQDVLDAMDKGIDLATVSEVLKNLQQAGIATYVYLLFGTPSESLAEARRTMAFVVGHHEAISFLNLAIFNMPVCSPEAPGLAINNSFYAADLSLYTDFKHPLGWDRGLVRKFLDLEFKRHPAIRPIILRDPSVFTSNHAPFFAMQNKRRGGSKMISR
ncbi:MAG: radical SAM protein [Proteobacteria bacterium]|nr:radical SAM protein [Pseudomonadota bacterium]MBU1715838.1 radical SAM protein [Pseudomonadota bacterium]